MKLKATFPFIDDMGTVQPITGQSSAMETAQQNILWHLNRMREHDGLVPFGQLPAGTKLEQVD